MKSKIIISIIVCLCGFFVEGCLSPSARPELEEVTQGQENSASNAEIIQIQQEIVKLRLRIFDDTQIKMENAQATLKDLVDAKAKLTEAQIKLAEFLDRNDLVIQELQSLVQFYVNARGQLLEQLESGTGKGKELYEIEIALMETNIRLTQAIAKLYPSGVQGVRAQ